RTAREEPGAAGRLAAPERGIRLGAMAAVFASARRPDALPMAARGLTARMTEDGAGESYGLLADQRLGRTGLAVKLDRGFAEGTYGVYVEFDELAARAGFTAAR